MLFEKEYSFRHLHSNILERLYNSFYLSMYICIYKVTDAVRIKS